MLFYSMNSIKMINIINSLLHHDYTVHNLSLSEICIRNIKNNYFCPTWSQLRSHFVHICSLHDNYM